MRDSGMGVGGLMRDQNGTWIMRFSGFEGKGDVYLHNC